MIKQPRPGEDHHPLHLTLVGERGVMLHESFLGCPAVHLLDCSDGITTCCLHPRVVDEITDSVLRHTSVARAVQAPEVISDLHPDCRGRQLTSIHRNLLDHDVHLLRDISEFSSSSILGISLGGVHATAHVAAGGVGVHEDHSAVGIDLEASLAVLAAVHGAPVRGTPLPMVLESVLHATPRDALLWFARVPICNIMDVALLTRGNSA